MALIKMYFKTYLDIVQEHATEVFVPEDKEALCSMQAHPLCILYKSFLWLFKFN